jgi:hypothetical protein
MYNLFCYRLGLSQVLLESLVCAVRHHPLRKNAQLRVWHEGLYIREGIAHACDWSLR